jgi:hypothetical protein
MTEAEQVGIQKNHRHHQGRPKILRILLSANCPAAMESEFRQSRANEGQMSRQAGVSSG